ncbi:hypothetical protein M409DRAFT_19260 [Zasmidium cellare ATCC 36951]|uniref:Uncharacterized protein n=1 Tax=Zasmidium cellare ATCC 36951 TaxID=1080233 RepID=A0A6A6CXA8_ZASCE|nr:uncharacterized protein M409DRAFT_19260 [Zasmidium cellare ATCC 36951]KAF2170439.1 hypothetical protein M409DRAFT_19260 [Zasmidium cellare ATCC 36951]
MADLTQQVGRDLFTDQANEILNDIFMRTVVHRDYRTGEKRPIVLKHFVVIARRALRLSLTCKKFHHPMIQMFYGQNTFAMEPVLESPTVSSSTPKRIDIDGRSTNKFRKEQNKNGLFRREPDTKPVLDVVARGHGLWVARSNLYARWDSNYLYRQAMLIPTQVQRTLMKNIIITFYVEACDEDQDFQKTHREGVTEDCGKWFSVLHSAAWLRDFDLETITIALVMYPKSYWRPLTRHARSEDATYEKAKETIKHHIDALLADVKAKKKEIKWPAEW